MPCPRCKLKDYGTARREDKIHHMATKPRPSVRVMEKWVMDGVARATDGCKVEPDGKCKHGHSSWLLALGII